MPGLRPAVGMDALVSLEESLRSTLQKEAEAAKLRFSKLEEDKRAVLGPVPVHTTVMVSPSATAVLKQAQEREALNGLKSRESRIDRRKEDLRSKVAMQMSKVEEHAKRLEQLKKELETLEDPTRREVSEVRKKIEAVDKDLKPLKMLVEKKEQEYKAAAHAFNEKSKVKSELVGRLMETVSKSERARLLKLDELNRYLEAMDNDLKQAPPL